MITWVLFSVIQLYSVICSQEVVEPVGEMADVEHVPVPVAGEKEEEEEEQPSRDLQMTQMTASLEKSDIDSWTLVDGTEALEDESQGQALKVGIEPYVASS